MESKKAKQTPSIGRIVHYQRYGTPGGEHKAEPSPAVITEVFEDDECQLFVMNPNGLFFNRTPYSEEPKPGHWNWPPVVPPVVPSVQKDDKSEFKLYEADGSKVTDLQPTNVGVWFCKRCCNSWNDGEEIKCTCTDWLKEASYSLENLE